MSRRKAMNDPEELYGETVAAHGAAIERLARSCEVDDDHRRDLLQEIHVALWRSFASFAGRCSLRTWVYRVAHNVVASHVIRSRRSALRAALPLDDVDTPAALEDIDAAVDRQRAVDTIQRLIRELAPAEREIILLYLEGLDAASIAEVAGISAGNVATKIHRIKKVLADRFRKGEMHV